MRVNPTSFAILATTGRQAEPAAYVGLICIEQKINNFTEDLDIA